jgi:hypothetical protein
MTGALIVTQGPTYLSVHLVAPALHQAPSSAAVSVATTAEPVEPDEAPAPASPDLIGAQGRLVAFSGDRPYLILSNELSRSWAVGKRHADQEDMLITATQALDEEELPARLAGWHGETVVLYDVDGERCTATVGAPLFFSQDASDNMPIDDPYALDYAELSVAAPLAAVRGDCGGSLWARHQALPAVSPARVAPLEGSARREAVRAFRHHPSYLALQKRYRADGHVGKWDRMWDGTPTVQRIESDSQRLIFVGAQVGGCGEFEGNLGLLFERQEDGSLDALHNGDFGAYFEISGAADMDGDGDLELIADQDGFDRTLLRQDDALLHLDSQHLIPIHFCRC